MTCSLSTIPPAAPSPAISAENVGFSPKITGAAKELRDLQGAYALIAEVIHGLSLQPKFSLDGGCDEFNDAGIELDDLRIRIEAREAAIGRVLAT